MPLQKHLPLWCLFAIAIAALVNLPAATIISSWFWPTDGQWQHLAETLLLEYVGHSLLLILGVAFGTGVIGVFCAWFTSVYSFPGRQFFYWAHVLPLAIPSYIVAYAYSGALEPGGSAQSVLQFLGLGRGDWLPDIHTLGGAIFLFSLVLYPYVYLLARVAFSQQSIRLGEAAQTLGYSAWRQFWYVALPLVRPAVLAGMALATMETLADFGLVEYLGVTTLSTGIYRAWFSLFDITLAARLASVLMLFVVVLLGLEHYSRRRMHLYQSNKRDQLAQPVALAPGVGLIVMALCALPWVLGFLLPVIQLLYWASLTFEQTLNWQFVQLALNSFALALACVFIVTIPALIMVYGHRIYPSKIMRGCMLFSSSGYAVPGFVIAIGVLVPISYLESGVRSLLAYSFQLSVDTLISGSILMLLIAYLVRFLSIPIRGIEADLSQISQDMDAAASTLGHTRWQILRRVHLPILRRSLLVAGVITFLEALKELPATLALRPLNFNTLAVRAYEYASDERLPETACVALSIVLVGVVSLIILTRLERRRLA